MWKPPTPREDIRTKKFEFSFLFLARFLLRIWLDGLLDGSCVALLSPYSIRKHPNPKFVQNLSLAIVFEGSSQGTEMCHKLRKFE